MSTDLNGRHSFPRRFLRASLQSASARVLIFVMSAVALSACSSPAEPGDPVVLDISAAPSVESGAVLAVTLTLRNTSRDSVLVHLGGLPGWHHDIFVRSQGGELVWRRLHGRALELPLQHVRMGPLEIIDFREEWPVVDNDGNAVPPGRYDLYGVVRAAPEDFVSLPTPVTVLP